MSARFRLGFLAAIAGALQFALAGAQAAINAVGIFHDTGRQKLADVHVDGARNVARAACSSAKSRSTASTASGNGSP